MMVCKNIKRKFRLIFYTGYIWKLSQFKIMPDITIPLM